MKNKEIKKDETIIYKEVKDDRTIIYESKMYTVDEFVSKYSKALTSYLLGRQFGDRKKKSHIVDLAVENSSFAESLYLGMDSFS
jgi:L-rhamnose isomerase